MAGKMKQRILHLMNPNSNSRYANYISMDSNILFLSQSTAKVVAKRGKSTSRKVAKGKATVTASSIPHAIISPDSKDVSSTSDANLSNLSGVEEGNEGMSVKRTASRKGTQTKRGSSRKIVVSEATERTQDAPAPTTVIRPRPTYAGATRSRTSTRRTTPAPGMLCYSCLMHFSLFVKAFESEIYRYLDPQSLTLYMMPSFSDSV